MYFWDNISNARYWNKMKCKKDSKKEYGIVAAYVRMNDLLDLTDKDTVDKMAFLWSLYKQRVSVPDDKEESLGFKLNCLYDYFDIFIEKYPVIKIIGKYFFTPSNDFFEYDLGCNTTEPILAAKNIYSVRNKKCILERKEYE